MTKYKSKKTLQQDQASTEQEQVMEELEIFEEFKKLTPEMRKMLTSKKGAREIAKNFSAMATIRLAHIAMTSKDEGRAIAACKDLIDRAEGKAVETQKVEHKYQELDEKQLESLAKSELEAAGIRVMTVEELLEMEANGEFDGTEEGNKEEDDEGGEYIQ